MSNFKETDSFLNPRRDMKIAGKHKYIPVELTFETEEEFLLFWDGIEGVCKLMQDNGSLPTESAFHKQLIEISNLFTEL